MQVEAKAQEIAQEPQVDKSQIVHDTLSLVADAVILRTVHARFSESLGGASQHEIDAIEFLYKHFEGIAGYGAAHHHEFNWLTAKENFVDNFSRLALRSQTQVATNTGKTYGDIQDFIHSQASNESLQTKKFARP